MSHPSNTSIDLVADAIAAGKHNPRSCLDCRRNLKAFIQWGKAVRSMIGLLLYAIAYESFDVKMRRWTTGFLYVHAVSDGDARWQFWQSAELKGKRANVVGVAPVLGYYVDDNHGERLSV